MNILVADDDFVARNILVKSLAGMGEVDSAGNGQEAWEAVVGAHDRGAPYELIMLDIMMPVMDGQVLLRKIRALEASKGLNGKDRARIVMATTLGDAAHVVGSFREECDGYIRKPYTRASVLEDLGKYENL